MSIEKMLFEALKGQTGIKLSFMEVCSLMSDDAIATRVTNAACVEAGIEELGHDATGFGIIEYETWAAFKNRLKESVQ
jgi:hypothetical protein